MRRHHSRLVHGACILAISVLIACALPATPLTQDAAIALGPTPIPTTVIDVPMNPESPGEGALGRFAYAGGVEITGVNVRFGGLSDLDVTPGGEFLSIADDGFWVEAKLTFAGERLTGITAITSRPLVGMDGQPLRDKIIADAEGVALLANGDRLVSFERQHRVWRYPTGGARPVAAPTPPVDSLPLNSGLEGLAAAPALGDGAYLVGSEDGVVWLCTLSSSCRETALGRFVHEGFGLTGIAVSSDGRVIALATRAFEPALGVRVRVRLLPRAALDDAAAAPLDELVLDTPLTRDNVEGIALVTRPGGLRLYLLSDNNFSATQHTYLLAFDWPLP